jgi:hypothetical protein
MARVEVDIPSSFHAQWGEFLTQRATLVSDDVATIKDDIEVYYPESEDAQSLAFALSYGEAPQDTWMSNSDLSTLDLPTLHAVILALIGTAITGDASRKTLAMALAYALWQRAVDEAFGAEEPDDYSQVRLSDVINPALVVGTAGSVTFKTEIIDDEEEEEVDGRFIGTKFTVIFNEGSDDIIAALSPTPDHLDFINKLAKAVRVSYVYTDIVKVNEETAPTKVTVTEEPELSRSRINQKIYSHMLELDIAIRNGKKIDPEIFSNDPITYKHAKKYSENPGLAGDVLADIQDVFTAVADAMNSAALRVDSQFISKSTVTKAGLNAVLTAAILPGKDFGVSPVKGVTEGVIYSTLAVLDQIPSAIVTGVIPLRNPVDIFDRRDVSFSEFLTPSVLDARAIFRGEQLSSRSLYHPVLSYLQGAMNRPGTGTVPELRAALLRAYTGV